MPKRINFKLWVDDIEITGTADMPIIEATVPQVPVDMLGYPLNFRPVVYSTKLEVMKNIKWRIKNVQS